MPWTWSIPESLLESKRFDFEARLFNGQSYDRHMKININFIKIIF